MTSTTRYAYEEREKLKGPERIILGLIGVISGLGGMILAAQFFGGRGVVSTLTAMIGLVVAALAAVVILLAIGMITPFNADSESIRRRMREDAQNRRDRDLNKQVKGTIGKSKRSRRARTLRARTPRIGPHPHSSDPALQQKTGRSSSELQPRTPPSPQRDH